ncbi:MAG: serine/threonine protein kinase [Sandaracinaceae bacterium]|nr:MAG: serine/threonine protein kinase [Sandaracinaceae bacterium]
MGAASESAFLQERVARFGLWIGAISLAGLVVRMAAHIALGNAFSSFLSLAWGAHLAACVFVLSLHLALRGAPRPRPVVEWLEVGGLWGAALCYQVVGLYLIPEARADYTVLLAMNVMFVGRAAFVPSSPRRTAWVTACIGAPMVALSYASLALRGPDPYTPPEAQWTRTLNASIWWIFITLLCVVITRTIYGLRAQVKEARRLGQYQLEALLAAGGMGEIYRARHALLRRPTAVKLIRPDQVGERTVARFEREAKRTAALTHPNTVTVYDYGRTDDGVFYYAMELLDGADLQTVIDETGPMPAGRACRILAQVAGALDEAHREGLIHRDIKPGNVILVERGGEADVAKVVDFGLVKAIDEQDLTVTEQDKIVGTPLYVSPEAVAAPETLDGRADLYALGALGYFLLTGKPPFGGKSAIEVYTKHLEDSPTPPSEHAAEPFDPALDRLLLACLAKDPDDRPQTAREVEVRLADLLERLPAWDAHDAARWWSEHGPRLRARRDAQQRSAPGSLTLAPHAPS